MRMKQSIKQEKPKKAFAKEAEKEGNKIYAYIAIGIIAIFLAIIFFGKFLKPVDTNKYEYNGYLFIRVNDFWNVLLTVDRPEGQLQYNLETRFGPKELEYVAVNREIMGFFHDADNKTIENIYLTIDPTSNNNSALALAAYDLTANLAKILNIGVVSACTQNTTERCYGKPVINCNDTYPVIYIKDSNHEEISYLPHRCIVVEGKDIGLVKAVNRLLFQWYGVMY
jgi:hypothetical protein